MLKKAKMMAYQLYLLVTLAVISYNMVFTQNTIDPEVSQTCASNNGLCGREIQQMYYIITHLKHKINALEVKEEESQSKINVMETKLTLSKSEIRDLKDNYLDQQREIEDFRHTNNAFEGNMSSLQSEHFVIITHLKDKINTLEVKDEEKQSNINALEANLNLSNSKIRDLTEQNENWKELKTNVTTNAEKYLDLQTEIDDLGDRNIEMKGNMSSLQSEHFVIITHLKDKINTLEVKDEEKQSNINALEANLNLSNSKIRDLTEQNENWKELKTNVTINAEKYLDLQTEIDDLGDRNIEMKGNMSSLQSENFVIITHLKDKINTLEVKDEEKQSNINALEANLNLSNSKIRDLTEQNENWKELKTNVTTNAEKYLDLQTEIDDLGDRNIEMKGNMSSLQSEHFVIITHLKDKINTLEVKDEEKQSNINALEANLNLSNSKIRDLTEQNENWKELKTNVTINAEKYLDLQTEIDDLGDRNIEMKGNISSLRSENLVLQQRIKDVECLLYKSTDISNSSNCADLYKLGYREDRVYTFDLCGDSYQLYCDMTQDGGGWTVFQRRFDGSVDFYRNWDTYKAGFGNLTTEFWLGNDLIALLTKHKKFDLHIFLEDFEGEHRYAEYSDFQLGAEDDKYTLNIGIYSGDAGDALDYHRGMKFSTYDSDNDPSLSFDCASHYRGAFWFNNCHHGHLNGQYSGAGRGQGLVWKEWKGFYYSLKKSIMKIRPIDF